MRYLLDNARARKLDQVTVGYTVAAWAVIQATSVGASAFDWQQWVLQAVIVVAVIGLPVVLIGAWAFGVRKETGGALEPSRADWHVLGVICLFLVVAGAIFVWAFWPRAAGPQMVQQPASTALPNSVAVLPFANTSGDASQKYFSEGITDELIGLLARNSALRVAARTSSFYFEGKNEDIRSIAQKLNVRAVLEGSVRQEGDHVRIEADLIDASSGYQLWSESYDRELKDILLLQSEIASAIVRALAPKILGKATVPAPRAIDPDVYRAYLKGQYLFDQRTEVSVAEALAIFQNVAEKAPRFADGQAALAYALLISIVQHPEITTYADQLKTTLARALALDPTNPQTLTVAIIDAASRWDWDTIIQYASILKRTGAHSAIGAHGMAQAFATFNLLGQSIAAEKESSRLDPLSVAVAANVEYRLFIVGRYEEAIASANTNLKAHPGGYYSSFNSSNKCAALASLNRIREAKIVLGYLASSTGADARAAENNCNIFIAIKSGQKQAARTLIDEFAKGIGAVPLSSSFISPGFYYAQLGDYDKAVTWYARDLDGRTFEFWSCLAASTPQGLFQSPQWKAFEQKPVFMAWSAARQRAIAALVDPK